MILGKWPNWSQFFSVYLFQLSTCFEQPCAHHQENQLYQYNLWYMSLCVGDHFVCRSERNWHNKTCRMKQITPNYISRVPFWPAHEIVTDTEWHIPEVVLTQLLLLKWAQGCLKQVENWNKYIEKNCASSWSFTKNHNEMHDQQNIKLWNDPCTHNLPFTFPFFCVNNIRIFIMS